MQFKKTIRNNWEWFVRKSSMKLNLKIFAASYIVTIFFGFNFITKLYFGKPISYERNEEVVRSEEDLIRIIKDPINKDSPFVVKKLNVDFLAKLTKLFQVKLFCYKVIKENWKYFKFCHLDGLKGRQKIPKITTPISSALKSATPSFAELRKKFGRSTNETLFSPECDVRFQTRLAIILPFREDQNDIVYEDQLKWLLNYLIPLLQR